MVDACAEGLQLWKLAAEFFKDIPLADLRAKMLLTNLERFGEIIFSKPEVAELDAGIDHVPNLRVLLAGMSDETSLRKVVDVDMVAHVAVERLDGAAMSQARATSAVAPAPAWSPAPSIPSQSESTSQTEPAPQAMLQAEPQAEPRQSAPRAGGPVADTVRVDTAKLDSLLNAAGELVITKARIAQLAESFTTYLRLMDAGLAEVLGGDGATDARRVERRKEATERWMELFRKTQHEAQNLRDAAIVLHRHAGLVQDVSMQMRMVPIGPLFQRFHRLVRDVSKQRGKSAKLLLEGESTELDKKLIDELTDPLTHMIRNSVDHGLEEPAERVAAGKAEQGTIRLDAYHEGGQICIRIRDDGKGLSVKRIREKIVENNLLPRAEAEKLSDAEAIQYIFRPGFSTAAQVTNISGRGVGMDIVSSKIAELKGKVEVETVAGEGTTFVIRLPLTLAMIQGLLVEIGGAKYAIPLESVREIVDIRAGGLRRVQGKGLVIFIREQVVPVVDLGQSVGIRTPPGGCKEETRGVVTKGAGELFIIPVDRVIGEEEIVVKGLSSEFSAVKGISGATILGDGSIALIFDIPSVGELCGVRR